MSIPMTRAAPQFQGGDAEDAGAATKVDYGFAGQIQPVQPLQAECRGGWVPVPKARPGSGMTLTASGFGTSRQLGQIQSRSPNCMGWNDHPFAHPVLVFQLLDLVAHVFTEDLLEEGDGGSRIGFGVEQSHYFGLAPERVSPGMGSPGRAHPGIHKGHRLGPTPQQHVAHLVCGLGSGVDSNLYPGHGVGSSPNVKPRDSIIMGPCCRGLTMDLMGRGGNPAKLARLMYSFMGDGKQLVPAECFAL